MGAPCRSEYCNAKHSASDPLNGTKLGTQLENDLASPKDDSVKNSLLAVPLLNPNYLAPGEKNYAETTNHW